MTQKKKGAKKNLWRRTLHYYWRATKKHKLLFVIGILVTPIVVASRTVLTPYFTADIIGKISSGIDPVAEWSTLMPSIVGLLACYLIGSELLGHVRIWAIWKLELKVAYDLATYCFDKVCTQSMRFHSNRFSGSLVSQTNKFIGSFERFFDIITFDILYIVSMFVFIFAVLVVRAPFFVLGLFAFVFAYIACSALMFKKISHLSKEHAEADLETVKRFFAEPPKWAKGLPLKGAGYITDYYLKD